MPKIPKQQFCTRSCQSKSRYQSRYHHRIGAPVLDCIGCGLWFQPKHAQGALNNPSIQGDWDMDLLEKCLRGDEVKIDIEDAGFNLGDVYNTFGYSPLESNSEQLTALAEQLRGLRERHRAHQAKSDARNDFNYYRVPVFANDDEALEFDELLEVPHNRFTDGRLIMSALKYAREHGWQASGAERT